MRTYLHLRDRVGNRIYYWYDDAKPLKMRHREDQAKPTELEPTPPPVYRTHVDVAALKKWLKEERGWVGPEG